MATSEELSPICPSCGCTRLSPVANQKPLSWIYACPECGWQARLCALCRAGWANSRHHLIPRSRGGRGDTRPVCTPCHRMVHATLTEKQLEREYASIEALREHPVIRGFIAWRRDRPGLDITVRNGRWFPKFR